MNSAQDECDVSKLAAMYTDAVNRGDWKAMARVYAEDGILVLGDAAPIVGSAAIERAFRHLVEIDREFIFQMSHSGLVHVDGRRARGRLWFSELKKPTGMPYECILGYYEDEATRFDLGWRFTRRVARRRFRWELPQDQMMQDALATFMTIPCFTDPNSFYS